MKWGKQKFDNVEVNTDETPEVFKMQLFSLSGEYHLLLISTCYRLLVLKGWLLTGRRS